MKECRWCGETHIKGTCPRVKAIEFFADGIVRRVEFMTPNDYRPITGFPYTPQPMALQPPLWWGPDTTSGIWNDTEGQAQ